MNALVRNAELHPTRIALVDGARRFNWQEIHDMAARSAHVLREHHGVRRGDIVATSIGGTAEHVILLHAIWLCGAAVAPLNLRLPAQERNRQIAALRPSILITDTAGTGGAEGQGHSNGGSHAEPASPDAVQHAEPAYPEAAQHAEPAYSAHVAELMPEAGPMLDAPEKVADHVLCSVLFTSGSSGRAKAVPHTWGNHRASAEASAANLGMHDDDLWQCVIPLYHIGGLAIVTRTLQYGTAMSVHDGFDGAEILRALRTEGVTITSLVPTMLFRLFEADRGFDGESAPALRAVLLGGAPAGSELIDEARRRSIPVLATYGLTESCSQAVTASPDEDDPRTGRPLPGVAIEIRSESGERLAPHEEGDIWLRGAMVTAGYLHAEEKDQARFSDGWFRTGDIGALDEDGRLRVCARREDVIISGGENLYPAEVEDVLRGHPAVHDVCVLGVEDAEWGQRVAAVVELGEEVSWEELEEWCRARLAAYKLPRQWKRIEALPRTPSGKVVRAEARMLLGENIS